ncbi:MAG: hypothetical protein ACJ741_04690 [Pyrinomonadaceae bacterium]
MKQTIRITVTHENFVSLGGALAPSAAWCSRCDALAAMLTPEQAAALAGVGVRQIFRWVETGRLHFVEIEGASPLLCFASLPAARDADEAGARERISRESLNSTRKVG